MDISKPAKAAFIFNFAKVHCNSRLCLTCLSDQKMSLKSFYKIHPTDGKLSLRILFQTVDTQEE